MFTPFAFCFHVCILFEVTDRSSHAQRQRSRSRSLLPAWSFAIGKPGGWMPIGCEPGRRSNWLGPIGGGGRCGGRGCDEHSTGPVGLEDRRHRTQFLDGWTFRSSTVGRPFVTKRFLFFCVLSSTADCVIVGVPLDTDSHLHDTDTCLCHWPRTGTGISLPVRRPPFLPSTRKKYTCGEINSLDTFRTIAAQKCPGC